MRNRPVKTALLAPGQKVREARVPVSLPLPWVWLSVCTALLAAAGSIVGLLFPAAVYGGETTTFFDAAIAQDLVNLFLVAPLIVICAVLAARGSLRAWLCLPGLLAFTAYNYAIYAFSIHFGPLFLIWVAVLGLSFFTFAGTLAALKPADLRAGFASRGVLLPAWFLLITAVLFTLLWLREIIPDLLAGRPSTSAATWNVPTNPVHVLDLAIFLPAIFACAVALLRRRWFGYATAAGALIFLGLTALPILLTPFVAHAQGHTPGWAIMVPMGIIAVAVLAVLWQWLRPGVLSPLPAAV